MSFILYSPFFGVVQVDGDNDTVAFVGTERIVRVDYDVGDFEDLGDDDQHIVHMEHIEVMR